MQVRPSPSMPRKACGRLAAIIASSATRTDGLSKTVFILGPEKGLAFINSLTDADAIVIAADGKVSYSKGLTAPN